MEEIKIKKESIEVRPQSYIIFSYFFTIFIVVQYIFLPLLYKSDSCQNSMYFFCISAQGLLLYAWLSIIHWLFFFIISFILIADLFTTSVSKKEKKILLLDFLIPLIIVGAIFILLKSSNPENILINASLVTASGLIALIIHSFQRLLQKIFVFSIILVLSLAGLIFIYLTTIHVELKQAYNLLLLKNLKCELILGSDDNAKDLRAQCLMRYAVEKNDIKLCSKITNTHINYQEVCQGELNMKTARKEQNCELLTSKNLKITCYSDRAREEKNPEFCEKLPGGEYGNRNTCYQEIANILQNPALCDKIEPYEQRDWRDVCYLWASKENPDKTICDKITREGVRNDCYLNLKK